VQVRAIAEAACEALAEGGDPRPEIMIPLVSDPGELATVRRIALAEVAAVLAERGAPDLQVPVGTMVETPRAALVADAVAEHAEFLSFGTNDLTQMTYGISRDDAETGFLVDYLDQGVLADNPFAHLDPDGVGRLIRLALAGARATRPGITAGICGEHGGDPRSIALCHAHGLDYVSCSPFRIPVARLAAAHAALAAPASSAAVARPGS
jgi:pyruvate, orthophosphate dikinase